MGPEAHSRADAEAGHRNGLSSLRHRLRTNVDATSVLFEFNASSPDLIVAGAALPAAMLVLLRSASSPVTSVPGRRPIQLRRYGVDVPAMLLELHEWDIHALYRGTDGVRGRESRAARLSGPEYSIRSDLSGDAALLRSLPRTNFPSVVSEGGTGSSRSIRGETSQ